MKSKMLIGTVFCLSLTVVVSHSAGDDWPKWFGADGDGVWKETGMIDQFSEDGAKITWRHEIGAGYTGPSVANGRVFVMDRNAEVGGEVENEVRKHGELPGTESVICLNAATGEEIWKHEYQRSYKIAYPTGPRCTPTVDDDRVYTLGAMGTLKCLQAADGQVLWQKELMEEYETKPPIWGYASHPTVDGDKLLVPVGGDGSALVAFDKMTGQELWRSLTALDVAYAPLVMYEHEGERQLIFWHSDGVASVNPENGTEYWTVKFPEERNMSQTSIATPRIVGNQLFVSEYYKGSLLLEIGSDPPSVKEIWRSYKTDPRHEKGLNSMMTTPVIKNGFVYGIGYNAKGQGILRCIELASGEHQWTKVDWMAEKGLMFSTAFIVENEDRYYMMNDIGELVIAKMSPTGFEELDRAKILEPTGVARGRKVVWSHPAFSNGFMYTRNDNEIVCVDLKKER